MLRELGLDAKRLIITVRPPATWAHYHNPKSAILFDALIDRLQQERDAQCIVLPRMKQQGDQLRAQYGLDRPPFRVLEKAVDALSLMTYSDAVFSGGGTMIRKQLCWALTRTASLPAQPELPMRPWRRRTNCTFSVNPKRYAGCNSPSRPCITSASTANERLAIFCCGRIWISACKTADTSHSSILNWLRIMSTTNAIATSTQIRVPFLDLTQQYANLKAELAPAILDSLDRAFYIDGPAVKQFEADFARYCGVKECVALDSGTAALHLTFLGLGIGPGDEVIVPTNTFIASAAAVVMAGATVVLVDSDAKTWLMDPNQVESRITTRTKAVLAVHLYGQPLQMDPLRDICQRKGLYLIEDAAQAHGAKDKGQRAGSLGDVACFSFYPGKNLGAYGDGGAITTNDSDLAVRVRRLANHGRTNKHEHSEIGWNFRMDEIQGVVLKHKLTKLDRLEPAAPRTGGCLSRAPSRPPHQDVPRTPGLRSCLPPFGHQRGEPASARNSSSSALHRNGPPLSPACTFAASLQVPRPQRRSLPRCRSNFQNDYLSSHVSRNDRWAVGSRMCCDRRAPIARTLDSHSVAKFTLVLSFSLWRPSLFVALLVRFWWWL